MLRVCKKGHTEPYFIKYIINIGRQRKGRFYKPFFFYAMAREFSKAFYNSQLWKDTRAYILKRDKFLCVECGRPAEEVHHIKHLTPQNINDPNVTVNPDNLKSLCRECHFNEHKGEHGNGRKNAEEYKYEFDSNGYLIKKTFS